MSELYELPNGWEWAKLKTLTKLFSDGDWIESKDQSSNGVRLIQTGNVGIGLFKDRAEKSRYISKETFDRLNCTEIVEDDCLISRLPEPIGRSCLIPKMKTKMITSVDCTIIRFNDKIVPQFFVYYSQSNYYFSTVASFSTGATRLRISKKNLSEIPIPLPPLSEQQRIVKKLDLLFEKIDKAISLHQKNIDEAEAFMGSVLNEVFEELEEKYPIKIWGDVLTIKNGKHYKDVIDENGKYPIYGSGGIINYANQYICNEDTVIIGRKGTINNPIFVREKFWNIDTAFGIEANRDILIPMFLFYFTKQFNFLDLNKSTTLPSLAKTHLLQINMVLPPLNIQQKVVQYLDETSEKIERVKTIQKEKMDSLKALKASILDKAFRGEI